MIGNQRGFTLVEMILSVIIIGMLAGLSLPLYQSFATRNDADITTESIANLLRRGNTYARGAAQDSTWSVRVDAGSATLYKGATYATRDTTYDEIVSIPASYNLSGLSEVSFSKLTGLPSTAGSVTISIPTNETRTVAINAKGMVSY
jgi:prepilin-type N-terminal cleavage/methylation domain-containing protein